MIAGQPRRSLSEQKKISPDQPHAPMCRLLRSAMLFRQKLPIGTGIANTGCEVQERETGSKYIPDAEFDCWGSSSGGPPALRVSIVSGRELRRFETGATSLIPQQMRKESYAGSITEEE